jgi:ParB/RepB/Spo0J family partition protein
VSVRNLPAELLIAPTGSARTRLQDLSAISESIRTIGITVPLTVSPVGNAADLKYEIISGYRRYAAAADLEMLYIPCQIFNCDRKQRRMLRAAGNINARTLSRTEEAQEYRDLLDLGFTQRHIAKAVSRSPAHVCRMLRLLELPQSLQARVDRQQVSVDVALGYARPKASRPAGAGELQLRVAWQQLQLAVLRGGDVEAIACLQKYAATQAADWIAALPVSDRWLPEEPSTRQQPVGRELVGSNGSDLSRNPRRPF